ncbi:hypothetical protein CDD81_1740 [Ophiocordyceps australis]|uniref:Uncharacterized protein n=1 Tax=Ophiocordyceps australis TaxID=1399860 RepID=A0A2C5YFA3_9HYPO|nr:hypothetical protein CDD81_1740 [Ophiocordyceps australis]
MASSSTTKFDSALIKTVLRLATQRVQEQVSDVTHNTMLCFWPGPKWRGKCWCSNKAPGHSWRTCDNVFARLPGRRGSLLQKCMHETEDINFEDQDELATKQEARHELCFSVGEMVAWYFEDFLARRKTEGLPAVQELATGVEGVLKRYKDEEEGEEWQEVEREEAFYDAEEEIFFDVGEQVFHAANKDLKEKSTEEKKRREHSTRYWTVYQFCLEMACAIDTSKAMLNEQTHGLFARHVLGLLLAWQGHEAESYTSMLGDALLDANKDMRVVRRTLLGELVEGRLVGMFEPERGPWAASELEEGGMPTHF